MKDNHFKTERHESFRIEIDISEKLVVWIFFPTFFPITLPETYSHFAPENSTSKPQKEDVIIPTIHFQVLPNVSFREGKDSLVGGFNPFEKYDPQNGFIFPKVWGENNTYLSCHHLR